MSMPRSLVMAAALAALVVTALAVPVAAAKTKLEIVNGIPGKKVDVCVNGVEIKSGLRYGKFVFKTTRTARATVKFYKRDPRRCGGKLLGKKTSGLDDATWVITRRFPLKVVVFDNSFLTTPIPAGFSLGVYRHAADLGTVQFSFQIHEQSPSPINPNADPYTKGSRRTLSFNGTFADDIFVTYVDQGAFRVVSPDLRILTPLRRREWILVGTTIGNAKLVFIDRPATLA